MLYRFHIVSFVLEKIRETIEKSIRPRILSLHSYLRMIINSVCVCGAGTMGSGIAQLSAAAGVNTTLYEWNQDVLENSKRAIEKSLQTLVERGKITGLEKEQVVQRIQFTHTINECMGEMVIEAIVENVESKINLFNQLAAVNSDKTIFATNTSSLSITEIANKISNPQRFAGMHFFNPAPVMKLVEVITAERTSSEVVRAIVAFAKQLGKVPVVCKDSPGFIVNRVARPFYIESLRLVEENAADFEKTDRLLEATGFKMVPFKLMDLIGNDINYAVSKTVFEQLNKPERLKPSFIQREKVEQGELGKKSGKGYYKYN